MGFGLIGVPVAALILEEIGGPDLVRTVFMGTLIAILLNVSICFVLWGGLGGIRKLRDRDPDLPQTDDPRIDTGDPLGVWFPDGKDGEAFVAFYQGEDGTAFLSAKLKLPVGFEIGHGLRYLDPETGGIWTLPTKEGPLS